MTCPAPPPEVAAAYERLAPDGRARLLALRAMIFDVAAQEEVGALTEALRWGEPAYLTEASKAGTTLRLGLSAGRPAIFVNCRTTLVDGYRADFGGLLEFEGTRAVFPGEAAIDGTDTNARTALAICLARALTYHRAKRRKAAR